MEMDHILDLEKPAGLNFMSASRRACRRFYASAVWPLFKYVKPMQAPHSSFLLPSHPLWRNEGSLVEASAHSQQTVSKHKSGIGDFMAPRLRSWFPLTAVLLLESSPRPAFKGVWEVPRRNELQEAASGVFIILTCSSGGLMLRNSCWAFFEQWLRDNLWTD